MTRIHEGAVVQISAAYRAMAAEARYRPAAPGDGMGSISVPEAELDIERECADYTRYWWREEDTGDFRIGSCDHSTRTATIYTVEAARQMCSVEDGLALQLLKMAVAELEAVIAGRN